MIDHIISISQYMICPRSLFLLSWKEELVYPVLHQHQTEIAFLNIIATVLEINIITYNVQLVT